jgi:hypothetical protein
MIAVRTGNPSHFHLKSDWAIFRKDGTVAPLIEPGAESPFPVGNQFFHFGGAHLSEVVDVQIALRAMADAIVSNHAIPVGGAGRSYADIFHYDERLCPGKYEGQPKTLICPATLAIS